MSEEPGKVKTRVYTDHTHGCHVAYRGTSLIRNIPPPRKLQQGYLGPYGGPREGGVLL